MVGQMVPSAGPLPETLLRNITRSSLSLYFVVLSFLACSPKQLFQQLSSAFKESKARLCSFGCSHSKAPRLHLYRGHLDRLYTRAKDRLYTRKLKPEEQEPPSLSTYKEDGHRRQSARNARSNERKYKYSTTRRLTSTLNSCISALFS